MNYPSIEIQNLLSENLLESLGQENSRHRFTQPESFSWEKYSVQANKKNNANQIADAYENLIARWDLLSSDFPSMNLSDLREKWIKHFFSQFGFDLQYQKSAIEADSGNKFILSYRGWEGANAPIVHSSSFQQDLDTRPKEQAYKYSPHDTLQRFLNQSNSDLWGVVTNGRCLRILRDFSHQSRKAYIQFDLEILFEGRHYEDFRILWRLIHPSRFIPKEDEKCILENLFEESKSAGVAIGENLRKNIGLAIESLANGFLLATPDLLNKLVDNNENCMQFYQQILRIIYRVLFLFYAEQRRLMPTRSTLYAQEYSMSSLRDKIERGETIDEEQFDLWEGLKATFNMVYHGVQELGITPYNGQLFNPDSVHWLINSQCRNDKLLSAIKYMSLFERGGITHRISYIELNVDEIGAIYESLLEYIPRISSKTEILESANKKNKHNSQKEISPNTFFLDPRGTSRKTSGSYYTHPGLVNALIESALVPVVKTKIEEAGPNKDNQEKALLSLKICDPACGSAAFLISVTEYLGDKLAKIRIQDEYPNDTQTRHARRDVLRHCIYGVDLNPMAVELAKVSLWLTAATNDLPLNFLDHKIKCGNSLIGTTPELIKKGIPPEAYSPVEGDDRNIARKRMKIAREYCKRREQEKFQLIFNLVRESEEAQTFRVTDLSERYKEDSTREQKEIEEAYKKHREDYAFIRSKYIADYWTAVFFWKHNDDTKNYPTSMMLDYLLKNEKIQLSGELENKIKEIAEEYKFFHWHLEFPEVFKKGGFDCVLGNPPWEKLTIYEREFFVGKDDTIATTQKKSEREKLITGLRKSNHQLYTLWIRELRKFYKVSLWFKESQYFTLSNTGELNTYPLFTELSRKILNENGRVGIIIKSALANTTTYKNLFSELLRKKNLVSFYDFKNWKFLFPNVGFHERFALLTLSGKNKPIENHLFAYECLDVEDLNDKKIYTLDFKMIKQFNPNTETCPVFLNTKDIQIAQKVYSKFDVIVDENNNINKWGISYITQIHMSGGSHLFNSKEELQKNGYKLNRNFYKKDNEIYLPLYEGKYIQNYDYRFASFENVPADKRFSKKPATYTPSLGQKQDLDYEIEPRYWIDEKKYIELKQKCNLKYQFQFCCRLVTNVISNARTCIGCIMPTYPANNLCLIFNFESEDVIEYCKKLVLFNSIFSSFVFDYVARQKVTANLLKSVLCQLPLPSLTYFDDKKIDDISLKDHIIDRVIKLIACTSGTRYLASILGYKDAPYIWDESEREKIITELDAIMAYVYGVSHDDLSYILDTFPIVRKKDNQKYGEYRTKKLILEKYDELKDKFKDL